MKKVIVFLMVAALMPVFTFGQATNDSDDKQNSELVKLMQDIVPVKVKMPPLIIVDGKESNYTELQSISPKSIESISVLKDNTAVKLYGEKASNGVVIIVTKQNDAEKVIQETDKDAPLIIVDGKECADIESISPESIASVTVLKYRTAVEEYGEKGRNGVIIITKK
jgi:TonB-dependent SusC/RagA subfamily outer membrane receptor